MSTPMSLCRSAVYLTALACAGVALPGRTLPTKPTPAQTELWKQQGRELPKPEVQQPTLDAGLPAYVPRRDAELSGHFKGASSDVLAALTKQWIAAFQKYYP